MTMQVMQLPNKGNKEDIFTLVNEQKGYTKGHTYRWNGTKWVDTITPTPQNVNVYGGNKK